jgi:hypothetical protein
MQDAQLDNELPDDWRRCGEPLDIDSDDEYPPPSFIEDTGPLRPVAEHRSGATLCLDTAGDGLRVALVQRLSANGWEARPTTDSAIFDDMGRALAFIQEVAEGITTGDDLLQAFAIVPHDGSDPTLVDGLIPTPADINDPPFADVFAIYTERTASVVTTPALNSVAKPIVELVYGTRTDLPDEVRELPSTTDAYDSAAIQVFTVSDADLTTTS